jgi:exosortase A
MKTGEARLPGITLPGRMPRWFGERAAALALVVSALMWLLVWHGETVQAMVGIWQSSDTFAHGFLILPISAWLAWQRRRELAALDLRPRGAALAALALAGLGWLAAHSAGVGVVQQFGVVLMIPLVVWAVLGDQVVRAAAFPLFFLLFAVPFGDFLEPLLMEHTADFAVTALRLTGIPVYREGLFFTIPSGSWSVVEACSGLRYLIASLTVGVLYAYLTYRTPLRRAAFVVASVVVPIVANWLRAYMIVMIGHLSGMKYAVGVDHLIYGWLFFGVVMLILFWVGSFWREDLEPGAGSSPSATAPRATVFLPGIAGAAVAAAAIVALWPATAAWLEGRGGQTMPELRAPQGGGWRALPAPLTSWTPRFHNPRAYVNQPYASGEDRAGLYFGYYRNQRPGAQLVSSLNTLVASDNREWKRIGEAPRMLTVAGRELPAVETQLRGLTGQLLVWRWYWIDGQFVMNPYWAKLLQAKSRLLGRGDDGAVVVLYAPYQERRESAERTLRDFAGAMLPSITESLEYARRSGSSS